MKGALYGVRNVVLKRALNPGCERHNHNRVVVCRMLRYIIDSGAICVSHARIQTNQRG